MGANVPAERSEGRELPHELMAGRAQKVALTIGTLERDKYMKELVMVA